MNTPLNTRPSGHRNDHVYKLRKRNFQRRLSTQLCYLGYMTIILQYIKYGSNVLTLGFRCLLQSILSSPFPSDIQLERIARNNNLSRIPYVGDTTAQFRVSSEMTNIPGAFTPTESIEEMQNIDRQSAINSLKLKARKILFHGALTVNTILILLDLLFPKDFVGQFEGNNLRDGSLQNASSPFINGNGLLQGEYKGGFFLQIVGELVPKTNLEGNLGMIFTDFLILALQYGLFILGCINFTKLDNIELDQNEELIAQKLDENSDGYDGNVLVTIIDPIKAIDRVLIIDDTENGEINSVV
ncbi:hypothetical protein Kpol_473p2 [Vanderwaltozyma polyspora DSM 70294]|uniref:Uncharacterized protein n=1 Tax=Vanderwaltozyma polyspora (strain ATCC 22028 / DSM 70294 / BCRC 21397 / CBS 2163 / NBRC 10782 / NRRL Y-8283 / UCD 57-17) TaxID=436907 RepID=A7TPZ4_VANPO|nr:uncharacterized protein Kpol_473p2 [Vanderwaltozyma polyspora DSM 70294]EDO15643.1 hypothetical protein Kpol_473p2 [Vanderwaltozyma polyspora DSM 70294]